MKVALWMQIAVGTAIGYVVGTIIYHFVVKLW